MTELNKTPLKKDENGREILLEVKNLAVTFRNGKKEFRAVHDVNFNVYKGETFALVGESGSGKTTIGRAIIRINPTSDGDVIFMSKEQTQYNNVKIPSLTKLMDVTVAGAENK